MVVVVVGYMTPGCGTGLFSRQSGGYSTVKGDEQQGPADGIIDRGSSHHLLYNGGHHLAFGFYFACDGTQSYGKGMGHQVGVWAFWLRIEHGWKFLSEQEYSLYTNN